MTWNSCFKNNFNMDGRINSVQHFWLSIEWFEELTYDQAILNWVLVAKNNTTFKWSLGLQKRSYQTCVYCLVFMMVQLVVWYDTTLSYYWLHWWMSFALKMLASSHQLQHKVPYEESSPKPKFGKKFHFFALIVVTFMPNDKWWYIILNTYHENDT